MNCARFTIQIARNSDIPKEKEKLEYRYKGGKSYTGVNGMEYSYTVVNPRLDSTDPDPSTFLYFMPKPRFS